MVQSKERFIVVPDVLTYEVCMIVLSDYRYWAEHEQELRLWCDKHHASFTGMLVCFNDKRTLTAFLLRWS